MSLRKTSLHILEKSWTRLQLYFDQDPKKAKGTSSCEFQEHPIEPQHHSLNNNRLNLDIHFVAASLQ